MKTIRVNRASDAPEPVIIELGEPIGTTGTLVAMANLVAYEGDLIATALFESLPQAVTVRVMVRLLERYGTQYLGGGGPS